MITRERERGQCFVLREQRSSTMGVYETPLQKKKRRSPYARSHQRTHGHTHARTHAPSRTHTRGHTHTFGMSTVGYGLLETWRFVLACSVRSALTLDRVGCRMLFDNVTVLMCTIGSSETVFLPALPSLESAFSRITCLERDLQKKAFVSLLGENPKMEAWLLKEQTPTLGRLRIVRYRRERRDHRHGQNPEEFQRKD